MSVINATEHFTVEQHALIGELRVNGNTVTSDTASPFAFSWDSTKMTNGSAALTVVAYDAAGNSAASSGVTVNLANLVVTDTTPPTLLTCTVVDAVTLALTLR